MKNIFLISFSTILVLALSACGGKDSSHESTNQETGKNQGTTSAPAPSPAPTADPTGQPIPPSVKGGKGNQGKSGPGSVQAPPVCDSSGPIGNYSGFLTESDGSFVPLTLKIDINNSPSTTGSPLKANMQVGLFGGVNVATDTAVYNFSSGVFTATFAAPVTGGTALKLSGTVKCGVFSDTLLQGGKGNLSFTLSKGTKSPFNNNLSFKYDVVFPNVSKLVRGMMTVGRLTGSTVSGDFSDLPTIPKLTTTFQFDDHTPIVADTTMYDPLRGAFELSMGGNVSFVKCGAVSLKNQIEDLEVPQYLTNDKKKPVAQGLECEVTSGGAAAQKMTAAYNLKAVIPVSPEYYSGEWQPVDKTHDKFPVVADITYTGTDGTNPPGYLFPKFPNLSAKIYICNEGAFSQRLPMISQAVDQVTGIAVFRNTPSSANSNIEDYRASYSFGWKSMTGPLVSYESGEVGSSTIVLNTPISKANWNGCNIPAKPEKN